MPLAPRPWGPTESGVITRLGHLFNSTSKAVALPRLGSELLEVQESRCILLGELQNRISQLVAFR